jgi:hypothetical protein
VSKPPKHPGLQGKLEDALRSLLKPDEHASGPDFLARLTSEISRYSISPVELEHIVATQSNYFTRAVNNGVLIRHGKKQGYSLATMAGTAGTVTTPSDAEPDVEPGAGTANRQWESLLHFPLTLALAQKFDAHVVSLPAAADSGRWANPDLLMIRLSERSRLYARAADLDPDAFAHVDASPPLILAAIEAKFGLRRSRSVLFQAVAEAAANSRWANEAWLAFFDRDAGSTPEPLPNDALALARATEVGIVELILDNTDPEEPELRVHEHVAAPRRLVLRFDELNNDRIEVLREAQRAIRDFDAMDETLLGLEDALRIRTAMERGLRNLGRQRGFMPTSPDGAFPHLSNIDNWKGYGDADRELVRALLLGAVLGVAGDAVNPPDLPDVVDTAFAALSLTGPERSGAESALREFFERTQLRKP